MAGQVSTLLDLIDTGALLLPEFQRGYVWNRDQVRGFMRSMYHRYPVGSLLVWQTRTDGTSVRGPGTAPPGYVDLLLDGQQRLTTLYGIVRGRPPAFFEGNADAFTGLHFHLIEGGFEFYAPAKMKNDPLWIDVTRLMKDGLDPFIDRINQSENLRGSIVEFMRQLNRLENIKEIEFHVEQITGDDKGVDVVVEIFDRVNSGGTKLSKADLALAKLCAEWPDARERMRSALAGWSQAGFNFKIDWLLRVVNAIVTGEALFAALAKVTPTEFADGLKNAQGAIDSLLNNISARLGLDHDRVLAGRYALPVLVRYLVRQGGKFTSAKELNEALYWFVHAFLWGRYVGASETTLNQDLDAVDTGGIGRLIELLRSSRGDLVVRSSDFAGYGMGARFYPLLYLLTRTERARDWWNGAPELSAHMLGKLAKLQIHHIFPKARLYEKEFGRGQVNAIANFCFLTRDTNLWVGARFPQEYFATVEEHYPGALASQWIPMDPTLWRLDRYLDFLEARRQLLADAANHFLDGLLTSTEAVKAGEALPARVTVESERDPELDEIGRFVDWMVEVGYAKPDIDLEIVDPETGETLAIAEAAWPNGLQEGMGDPVILELELTDESETRLVELGYRAFPSVSSLRGFVERYAEEAAGTLIADELEVSSAEAETGSGDVSLVPRVGWREWKIHQDHGVTDRAALAALDITTARLLASGIDVADLIKQMDGCVPSTPLTELPNIRRRKAQLERLEAAGISTVADASKLSALTASYSGTGLSSLPEQIDRARAALGPDPVYRRRGLHAISVPRADVEVDIDMENVEDGVYLWGALLIHRSATTRSEASYHSFVTWEPLTPRCKPRTSFGSGAG